MKKSFAAVWVVLLIATPCFVSAQSDSELDKALKSLEALVEKLDGEQGRVEETVKAIMQEHGDDFEAWAEKYSHRWEDWAKQFEERLSRWAEGQERTWQEWADEYSDKWETWAEKLEDQQFDSDELQQLLQGNMRMLSEMPLPALLERLMEEGAKGLESAPWESIGDLQAILQDAIKKSIAEGERLAAEGKLDEARDSGKQAKESEDEYILPVIENQQKGLQAKAEYLAAEANATIERIKHILETNPDVGKAELEKMLKKLIEQQARQRELARQVELAKQEHLKKPSQQRTDKARNAQESAAEQLKLAEEARRAGLRLAATLEKKDRDLQADAVRKKMAEVIEKFETDEKRIQEKNAELDALRAEVRRLRDEVDKMKRDR
jgi:hypothetical protein